MLKCIAETLFDRGTTLAGNFFGKGLGCFQKGWVIEQDKGSERGVGLGALRGTFLPAWGIKGLEHGVEKLSLPVDIEPPSPKSLSFVWLICSLRKVEVTIVTEGL
jgi:hypothetical protein